MEKYRDGRLMLIRPARPGVVVGLCTIINMIDGFDILISAVTGPAVAQRWGLTPLQLGVFFSSSLAGMTVGAVGLAPIADRIGRRRAILCSLILITAGMISSAAMAGFSLLVVTRIVTGLGVGSLMPAINTVVAETTSARRRELSVCVQSAGFPLGAAVVAICATLWPGVGWRSLFIVGGLASAFLAPLVFYWMPESLRLAGVASRSSPGPVTAAIGPALSARSPDVRSGLLRISSHDGWLILNCFFLLMFSFYFLANWMPKLLADYGFSSRTSIFAAALMNSGGVFGDLLFAALLTKRPARWLGPLFMRLSFVLAVVLGVTPIRTGVLIPVTFALGALLFGSMSSLYAIIPTVYPASVRATGTGRALGVGRIGAVLGPYVGGIIVSQTQPRAFVLLIMASPLLACAILTRRLSNAPFAPD